MRTFNLSSGLRLSSLMLTALFTMQGQAASCNYLGENADPVKQYKACPDSLVAAYHASLYQFQQGKYKKARAIYTKHGGAQSANPLKLLAPLFSAGEPNLNQLTANLAQQRLMDWHSQFKPVPFELTAPQKPEIPALPQLIKGEFETTDEFKVRVEEARQKRELEIAEIEKVYSEAVKEYNDALQINQQANQKKLDEHKEKSRGKKLEYLEEAYTQVFGQPYLADAQYNADENRFYARLKARNGGFDQPVTIDVPRSEAKNFKDNLDLMKPEVVFNSEDNQLKIAQIEVTHADTLYTLNLSSDFYENEQIAVTIDDSSNLSFDNVALLAVEPIANKLSKEDTAFFDEAVQLENDPELAKLRQQQAEAARKKQELILEQQRQLRLAEARAQLEAQQAEIARLTQGTVLGLSSQTKELVKRLPKASQVNKDDIAVIIGNRNYASRNISIPNVDYALNDASVMRSYASQTLGIPDSNIFYLKDASQSELVSVFGNEKNHKGRLFSRVKPQQSNVFVFYSGHGVPGVNDQRGYLLPVDADPSTVELNGYALDTLYNNLDRIGAKHVSVMLDSCFSGSSQSDSADSVLLVKNASPALLKLKSKPTIPNKSSIFTATTGSQVASWDTDARLGLFTYNVLQGLTGKAESNNDQQITGAELEDYLRKELPYQARRLYNREQTPILEGNKQVVFANLIAAE